jgi:excisionase family DNA binding protein
MREFTDMKWGTPQPISLRDTDLGLVRLRAFGQYSMQISDPKRFVDQIVGTQGLFSTNQIEDYLRNAVISRLTDVLGENMKSIFDLPQLFDEISAGMRAKVQDDFMAMGIALKQFMVVSINPTDETAKAIDERASMGAIGDVDRYMKYKTAQAMGDAAKAGGGASEGLGLGAGIGMGAGMAGMITNAMSNAQQAQPAQPAAVPSAGGAAAGAAGVMTLEEAANYLKVTAADVEAIITSGELKARKIGTQYRISKEAIDAYLAG